MTITGTGTGCPPAQATLAAPQAGSAARRVQRAVAVALALVTLAPLALSSAHLYQWAREGVDGLGLSAWLAWLPILSLDATSVVCVGMVTLAAWRGEKGGLFHLAVWVVAGMSAAANYAYGLSTGARYDEWFFPAMSLTGPALLDMTLAFVRRWYRVDTGLRQTACKVLDFGVARWLPWVATRETFAAWQVAQREGIKRPEDAIARVREMASLKWMAGADAVKLAFEALGARDPYAARVWLAARAVRVTQEDVEVATAPRDVVEMVTGSSDGMTAAEVARRWYGSDGTGDVERARRLLEESVPHQLVRDGSPNGGRGKTVRYRAAVAIGAGRGSE